MQTRRYRSKKRIKLKKYLHLACWLPVVRHVMAVDSTLQLSSCVVHFRYGFDLWRRHSHFLHDFPTLCAHLSFLSISYTKSNSRRSQWIWTAFLSRAPAPEVDHLLYFKEHTIKLKPICSGCWPKKLRCAQVIQGQGQELSPIICSTAPKIYF